MEKPKDDLAAVKELKKKIFGKNEKTRRKRKGPKGPNPLSVRKKQKRISDPRKTDSSTSNGKRRRKRRKMQSSGTGSLSNNQ